MHSLLKLSIISPSFKLIVLQIILLLLSSCGGGSGNVNDENQQCIIFESGLITQDTTFSAPCYKLPFGISIGNSANLTISPGVRLEFAAGRALAVREGNLFAEGTASNPVVFTGEETTPGSWDGVALSVFSFGNKLENVIVEYGKKNIWILGAGQSDRSQVSIKNVTVRYASEFGIRFEIGADIDVFENNILTLNNAPISLPAELVKSLGTDSSYTGNTDSRIHINSYQVDTDQTWKKLDAPYFLAQGSTQFEEINANLILEAGVTVISRGAPFQVGNPSDGSTGSLTALGTEAEPIIFTGEDKTPGSWQGVNFRQANSNNTLENVIIEYGQINLQTHDQLINVRIKNLVSREASIYGIEFGYDTQLDVFENVNLTANAVPLRLPANMVRLLGEDSNYSGNEEDLIHIRHHLISIDQTWHRLNAGYFIDGIEVEAELTLDAGVVLIFNKGVEFNVRGFGFDIPGLLIANGTIDAPVIFTGVDKTPGSWGGINFQGPNLGTHQLDHAIVEYAGNLGEVAGVEEGNINMECLGTLNLRISNSIVRNSAGWGIHLSRFDPDKCNINSIDNSFLNNALGDISQNL